MGAGLLLGPVAVAARPLTTAMEGPPTRWAEGSWEFFPGSSYPLLIFGAPSEKFAVQYARGHRKRLELPVRIEVAPEI